MAENTSAKSTHIRVKKTDTRDRQPLSRIGLRRGARSGISIGLMRRRSREAAARLRLRQTGGPKSNYPAHTLSVLTNGLERGVTY